MHLAVVDHGARSPEQGPRVGSQHNQGPRGRARQPPSRLWTWQRKAIDVSSYISRGGNELCKSWPHLLLGGTLIDTHSSVLTGATHSVLCDTFSPVSWFCSYCDGQYHYYENFVCDLIWLKRRADRSNSHLQPSCLSSAPYKLTVGSFPHFLFTLSTLYVHSECGPPSRTRTAGSRCHFCRHNRLGRPLIYL